MSEGAVVMMRYLGRVALLAGGLTVIIVAAAFAQISPSDSQWHVESGGAQSKWGEISLVYGADQPHALLWFICKGGGGAPSQYDGRSWIFVSPAKFGEASRPRLPATLTVDGKRFTFKLGRYGYMTRTDKPNATMGTQMDDGRAVMAALAGAETATIRFGTTEKQILIGRSGRAVFDTLQCPDMEAALKSARPIP
jgi:hypothetical protein